MKFCVFFVLLHTIFLSPTTLTKSDDSLKIDAPGYISELTATTIKGITDNPDPGTQQLTEYGSILQNTPYTLTLGRVSVYGLNFSIEAFEAAEYQNAPAVSANYTFKQALVRAHTMLWPTGDPSNITHGYAVMNVSGIVDHVVVAASRRTDRSYRAEVVQNYLSHPGSLENVDITEGSTGSMKNYVAEVYALNKVAISQEVTFVFKMYLENSVRKVDVSKHMAVK